MTDEQQYSKPSGKYNLKKHRKENIFIFLYYILYIIFLLYYIFYNIIFFKKYIFFKKIFNPLKLCYY